MTFQIKPHPARPKYNLGQRVRYFDHTQRPQVGEVIQIKATWGKFRQGREHAHISMMVTHPTYANGRIYLDQDSILDVEGGAE